MLQFRRINPINNAGDVEQRRGSQFVSKNSALMDVQSARPDPNHRWTRLDADQLVPLLVEVGQSAAQRLQNILYSQPLMLPLVHGRVFQVEHHSGSARVEHFDYEIGIVGWPGHLVALILAPLRQLNSPAVSYRFSGIKMCRFVVVVRLRQNPLSIFNQLLLPRSKTFMQRSEKFQKPVWQVALRNKPGRWMVNTESNQCV